MHLVLQMEEELQVKKDQINREFLSSISTKSELDNDPEGSIKLSLKSPLENTDLFEDIFMVLSVAKRDTCSPLNDFNVALFLIVVKDP